MSQAWKQPRLQIFLPKTIIKIGLAPNLDHETKLNKIKKTTCVKQESNKIYCKKEIKQGYDNKTYPKLMLDKLKVM